MRLVPIDLYLRPHQAAYITRLAERHDVPLSEAMRLLLDERFNSETELDKKPNIRKHVTLADWHIDYVETLAADWGCQRPFVLRRVIDDARENDPLALKVLASNF